MQATLVEVDRMDEVLLVAEARDTMPVVPHVGDMGQIHQHLVLFNHVALGHAVVFLEHIPHLRKHLVYPAVVENGKYVTAHEPGLSCDLIPGSR